MMKIAVTYEGGEIFQHFGHTETFKLYEVNDKEIVKMQVVSSNGEGHGALPGVLSSYGVDGDSLCPCCGAVDAGSHYVFRPYSFLVVAVDDPHCFFGRTFQTIKRQLFEYCRQVYD